MSAELNAHGHLMGNVRKTTKPHKLKMKKKTQKRIDELFSSKAEYKKEDFKKDSDNSKGAEKPVKGTPKAKPAEKAKPTGKAKPAASAKPAAKEEPTFVPSTRIVPNPPKGLGAPAAKPAKSGPARITPPGPAPRAIAAGKAAAAKKGTKNKSTIKVATPFVDLQSPNGGIVHEITDVPRQWKKKNG